MLHIDSTRKYYGWASDLVVEGRLWRSAAVARIHSNDLVVGTVERTVERTVVGTVERTIYNMYTICIRYVYDMYSRFSL